MSEHGTRESAIETARSVEEEMRQERCGIGGACDVGGIQPTSTRSVKEGMLRAYGCTCVDDDPGDCDDCGCRKGSDSGTDVGRELVDGQRMADYGDPVANLKRIGVMWGAILERPPVPARKVALCMAALKIAREANRHKADNLDDGSGYLHIAGLAAEEENAY